MVVTYSYNPLLQIADATVHCGATNWSVTVAEFQFILAPIAFDLAFDEIFTREVGELFSALSIAHNVNHGVLRSFFKDDSAIHGLVKSIVQEIKSFQKCKIKSLIKKIHIYIFKS